MHVERNEYGLMGEEELAQICAAKSSADAQQRTAALEELIRRNYEWVLRLCLFELREHESAAECAQEAMFAAAKGIAPFDGRARFRTWLFVITRRTAGRYRRRRWVTKRIFLEARGGGDESSRAEAEERPPAIEQRLALSQRSRVLLNLLRGLPERQRQAIFFHYYEDLSIEETAARMGCSAGSVKKHLSRGRAGLEKHIHAAGSETINLMEAAYE